MADDITKKGAERLGVECRPTFTWIHLSNRIYPKLHSVICLINDYIVYFEYKVEWEILLVPNIEKEWRARLVV